MASAEAEEGQHRQNHDNHADKIDKTIHDFSSVCPAANFSSDNLPTSAKFPARTGKTCKP
jgi:hypothetical protein